MLKRFLVLFFLCAVAASAQTNTRVNNQIVDGTLNANGNVAMKGTDPWADITSFGAKATGTTVYPFDAQTTCTGTVCTSASGGVYNIGDGITIWGAGTSNGIGTVSAPTVTPSLAVTGTVPDAPSYESVASPTGSTAYCYKVIAVDQLGGLTAPSTATCISTGLATLGTGAPLTVSTLTRSGKTVTVTTTGTQNLSIGALVHLYGMSNAQFEGYFNVGTVNNAGNSFTIPNTPMDTALGAASSATGGFAGFGPSNQITWTPPTGSPWKYYICGSRSGGAYHLIGTSMPTSAYYTITSYYDFGATMNGNQTYPLYVTDASCAGSATKDNFTTTVATSNGAGSFTLKTGVTTNVTNVMSLYDAVPSIRAAIQSIGYTTPGYVGGAIYLPPVPANGQTYGYPINSYFVVPPNIKIIQAGPLILNETMELGNNTNWDGGWSVGIGAGEFAFSGSAVVLCQYANPCIYSNGSMAGLYENLSITTNGANGTNIWMLDSTYNTTFRNVSFDTNQDATTDYFGKALVVRSSQSVGATVIIEDSSFGNGPSNAVDSTWSPTIYVPIAMDSSQATVTSSSIMDIKNTAMQLRGIGWNLAGGAYDFHYDRGHRQGGVNPFLSLGNYAGTPHGDIEISHLLLDSEVQPVVANLTSNSTSDPNTATTILRMVTSASTDVGGRPPIISGTAPFTVVYDETSGTYTNGSGVTIHDQNGITTSNINNPNFSALSPMCTDSSKNLTTSGCTGATGLSGMTATQVPVAATASTVTSSIPIQGTDSSLLSSGTISGTAATLCTDASGGATTTGCTGGSISGMTSTQIPVAGSSSSITSSKATTGSGNVVLATSPTLTTPALGTPSALVLTNATGAPTWNQNTTGSAAKWTTARNLAGNSVDGSANVAFANKFIVQGTTDTGLSGAQFLGALGTGIVYNTTSTGVLSIATAAQVATLIQSLTGCNTATFVFTPQASDCVAPNSGVVTAVGTPTIGQFGIWATASTIGGTSTPENIYYADLQAGANCGAKINAADAALSTTPGEIWVNNNCGLTTWSNVTLSAGHTLRFIQGGTYNIGTIRLASKSTITSVNETGGAFGQVILSYAPASGTVLQSSNTGSTVNAVELRGFTIDCVGGAGNTAVGLDTSGISNSNAHGVSVIDCGTAHFANGGVAGSTVYDNFYDMYYGASSASSGFNGIFIESSANAQHWYSARFSRLATQFTIGHAGTATDQVDCTACTFEGADTMAVDVVNAFGVTLGWPRFEGLPLGVKLEAVSSNEINIIHPYFATVTTQFTDLSGTNGYSTGLSYIGAPTTNCLPLFNTVGSGGSDQTVVVQNSSLCDNGTTVSTTEKISTTNVIDGLINTLVTTGTTGNLSDGFSSTIAYNEEGTAGTAVTYTLPVAKAGMRKCVFNANNGSAANTGALTIQTSGSGQFIIFSDGTLSTSGGFVASSGAAGDTACVMGIDTTHWQLIVGNGSIWTKH